MLDDLQKSENTILSYMDRIKEQDKQAKADKEFMNSPTYKLRTIEKEKEKAKDACINHLMCSTYKKSVPLNDMYKSANDSALNDQMNAFVLKRCPEGLVYYVHEGNKKGSPICKKICEAVESLVNDLYIEKELNVDNYDAKDLVFKMDDDTEKKLDMIASNLEMDDISSVINNNVKKTVTSELTRAKEQKERYKEFEKELAEDLNVKNESAIDFQLELNNISVKRDFVPSLFNGIMIGRMNKPLLESTAFSSDNYGTLTMYGYKDKTDECGCNISTPTEQAFLEAVQELTLWNMTKAFRLENFTMSKLRNIAQDYASGNY